MKHIVAIRVALLRQYDQSFTGPVIEILVFEDFFHCLVSCKEQVPILFVLGVFVWMQHQ
jgi:hypothetical protein